MENGVTFGLMMDVMILALLAATVYLGFVLHAGLRNFRESRSEMEGILNRLVANISQAESAIDELQESARSSAGPLRDIVKEARFLADELQFMNEAGGNLADRLEKLAEKNRVLVERMEQAGGIGPNPQGVMGIMAADEEAGEKRGHDDFLMAEEDGDEAALAALLSGDIAADERALAKEGRENIDMPPLQSQAERELFQALHRTRRKAAGQGA